MISQHYYRRWVNYAIGAGDCAVIGMGAGTCMVTGTGTETLDGVCFCGSVFVPASLASIGMRGLCNYQIGEFLFYIYFSRCTFFYMHRNGSGSDGKRG
jgi:hypothetical protein